MARTSARKPARAALAAQQQDPKDFQVPPKDDGGNGTQKYKSIVTVWFSAVEAASSGDGEARRRRAERVATAVTVVVSVMVKWWVGLHPHSGEGHPPMHGDFEAQRHWMEVTAHLPRAAWYRHELGYWGLDYPPLTAAHAWALGRLAHAVEPAWVALGASRGAEGGGLRLFMRAAALATDLAVMGPAAAWFSDLWTRRSGSGSRDRGGSRSRSKDGSRSRSRDNDEDDDWERRQLLLLALLLQPTLAAIDHGHFQFNAAMLGLALAAFAALVARRVLAGSVLFVLAIAFKQMALFYALPVFFFLLGICAARGPAAGSALLLRLGVTVIATFAACFAIVASSWHDVRQILVRIFPLQRGLYEDKVANVWCALGVLIKLRNLLPLDALVKLSASATLASVLPSSLVAFRRPTPHAFVYALLCGSLGFFLFAFQVHEKSILLPALPAVMLLLDEPLASSWFINVCMFSMFPLLKRDRLVLVYTALIGLWNFISPSAVPFHGHDNTMLVRTALFASILSMLGWHVAEATIAPPARYPDLFVVANVLISTAHFVLFMIYFNVRQMQVVWPQTNRAKKMD